MEATAVGVIRLWLTGIILVCAHDQTIDAAFLHVVPNRLQFFQYEPVTFHCEGDDGATRWKVVHGGKRTLASCNVIKSGTVSTFCTITHLYPEDSGQYCCESGKGRTNCTNITVSDGSVILDSPAAPVMEGDNVTLLCRNKNPSESRVNFFKDGRLIHSSSTAERTIHTVSLSDEGLYKCSISGSGESAESQLVVTVFPIVVPQEPEISPSPRLLWKIVVVSLMALLLVLGSWYCVKSYRHRAAPCLSTVTPASVPAENQTAPVTSSAPDTGRATYSAVTKIRKEKDADEFYSRPVYYSLSMGDAQALELGASSIMDRSGPSAGTRTSLTEDACYSTIQ
ncbi:high affinity immunoglobulin gamma Fc receptor I-like [Mastacembelus armatus]|uniref:high affinity immunoglobulin gamma Fc receptor I-like n=1 Tax=Mastacembelus armatus TaxID=205130 RepID=UPI000E4613E2|nr:high affinity immunoglobulin gamma Fc receptor I-like [Mastacembelus armatus]